MSGTSLPFKKTDYNAKIIETEDKIPCITSLATTAALDFVEVKIFGVCNPVKKTEHGAKISNIKSKYFTTADYDKFTNEIIDNKRKEKNS